MSINTVVNTNITALTAYRNLNLISNKKHKIVERLSSGKRINWAADDVAGFSIVQKMKAQIMGLDMAVKNSENTISLIKTADNSLKQINEILTKIKEITIKASNSTTTKDDRIKMAQEVSQLLTEIDEISKITEFNGKKLIDGSFKNHFFQTGANSGQGLTLSINEITVNSLKLEELKNAFGIVDSKDKEIYLDVNEIKVTGANGILKDITIKDIPSKAPISNIQIQGGNVVGTQQFKLVYKDDNGDIKELKVNYTDNAVSSVVANNIKTALEKAGLEEKFNISTNIKGELIIESKQKGSNSKFEIISATQGNKGNVNVSNKKGIDNANGFDSITFELWLNTLLDGDKIEINGKTYTKVGILNNENVENGFTNRKELEKLLENDGIKMIKLEGVVPTVEGTGIYTDAWVFKQTKKSNGNYEVDNSKVSNNPEVYSKSLKAIHLSSEKISRERAKLGAIENRLGYTINNLNLSSENLLSAKSNIESADMAKEMINLLAANILEESAIAMICQANKSSESVIKLLEVYK